jgi:hypothetical protein
MVDGYDDWWCLFVEMVEDYKKGSKVGMVDFNTAASGNQNH